MGGNAANFELLSTGSVNKNSDTFDDLAILLSVRIQRVPRIYLNNDNNNINFISRG